MPPSSVLLSGSSNALRANTSLTDASRVRTGARQFVRSIPPLKRPGCRDNAAASAAPPRVRPFAPPSTPNIRATPTAASVTCFHASPSFPPVSRSICPPTVTCGWDDGALNRPLSTSTASEAIVRPTAASTIFRSRRCAMCFWYATAYREKSVTPGAQTNMVSSSYLECGTRFHVEPSKWINHNCRTPASLLKSSSTGRQIVIPPGMFLFTSILTSTRFPRSRPTTSSTPKEDTSSGGSSDAKLIVMSSPATSPGNPSTTSSALPPPSLTTFTPGIGSPPGMTGISDLSVMMRGVVVAIWANPMLGVNAVSATAAKQAMTTTANPDRLAGTLIPPTSNHVGLSGRKGVSPPSSRGSFREERSSHFKRLKKTAMLFFLSLFTS